MQGWKRFFTYAWPAGILQRIKETNEEVNLYIFNSSGDWSLDEKYNVGEYNIHQLPDFTQFDGIILDLNNICQKEVRDSIVEAAARSGKPVLSIANEIDDFYYVGIDNSKAIYEVIAHLYEMHQCRKFWFVMADEENYENKLRVQTLKAFMEKHEIDYQDEDFYYDSYEYSCGQKGFAELFRRHKQLPDAIICANDNIAVGVLEAATKAGYQIPKDVLVTGFDNFDKAVYFTPSITTVSHIREEVGYACADILLKIWRGEKVSRFNYTGTKLEVGESCGCLPKKQVDRRAHAKGQIMYGIETDTFEEQVIALEYELMNCKTVREMTDWIPKCIPAFQCDAMYLVLDDRMNDFWKQPDYYDRHLLEDDEFCISGYPDIMNVEFAYEDGKATNKDTKQINGLFPTFEYPQGGTDFLFLPLHFSDKTVGYFVIRNAVYLMEKQYLFQVVNVLTSAMENLHKKEKLEHMNKVLAELYIKDAMTGLYNRMGYQKLVKTMFEEKKAKKENMEILFLDMDRLKYLNDTFGHDYGDKAICAVATAMLKYSGREAIPVRNGGDEFLFFLPYEAEDGVKRLIENIYEEIKEASHKQNLPFEVTVSVGHIRTDMYSDKTLDDYIREADEVMYQEKVKRKLQRK